MVIDQVLGVEGASLDVPIEQIPYAKVPVPYADQLVLPQPSRGLIHPDDAPPVLANLNAMPSSGALQAEELHSTNHALNVNMVGGGGGGGSAVVPQAQVQYTNFSGFGDIALPLGACAILYSAIGYAHSWRDDHRKTQTLYVGVRDDVSGDRFDFVETTADYSAMTYPPTDIMYPISLIFPTGLDIRSLMRTSPTMSLIFDGGGSFWGGVFCNLAYSAG